MEVTCQSVIEITSEFSYLCYVLHNFILFKSQLLIKLFYIIDNFGLICLLITCNCIYIYNQIVVNSVEFAY